MPHTFRVAIACVSLFAGMSLLSIVCYRFGRRRLKEGNAEPEVSGAIIGAVFALLGLLVAFTFSGAYSRFDTRRQLIVHEANAIGTAYLRLDLLPASAQPILRKKLREYAASRAALFEELADVQSAKSELARTVALEHEIWSQAVSASAIPEYQSARLLLLPALNEMIDLVTTRTVAIHTHPPLPVFGMLFALALACAGLTGYRACASEYPGHLYNFMLAAITACVLYLILDIEYPRYGLIRLDAANNVLVDLVKTMR